MRNIALFLICCLLLVNVLSTAFADELDFNQQDIEKFLSFADRFMAMARKAVPDSEALALVDLFYQDNEKLMAATEEFLKKEDWTYLKLNDFLYVTEVVLEYLAATDVLGGEMAGMLEEMLSEIPPEVISLIQKNKASLLKYFPMTDYTQYLSELGLTGDFDLGDMEEYLDEYPEDYPEEMPFPDYAEDFGMPEPDDEMFNPVAGTWVLGSNSMLIWNFREDKSLSVNEVSPVAAEVPSWEGSYQLSGNTVTIRLNRPHPFPGKFTIQGERLVGDTDYLIRR